MATDHYESQYGESLSENISEEFTPRIAQSLQKSDRVTPLLRRKLFAAVIACIEQRSNLLNVLDSERESLKNAHEELSTVTNRLDTIPQCELTTLTFDELETHWRQLDELERRCESLLKMRQRFVTEVRTRSLEIDDLTVINDYLYQTLDSHCPVLRATLDVIDGIEMRRTGSGNSVSVEIRIEQ